ncbi:MAG: Na+/H+ antiporter subunit B [Deltaproteobacteria bacterium]|nr:Na+/H+ antiporter subunit B [Deltaproteobacteria bacterium]
MKSLILKTATELLLPLILLFSIFLLLRGHQDPGGGFAGGLVAAGAFAQHALALSPQETRRLLSIGLFPLLGLGLSLSLSASALPIFLGKTFLQGTWWHLQIPAVGEIHLGTPLFFDIGVYLVVLSVSLTILFNLMEE